MVHRRRPLSFRGAFAAAMLVIAATPLIAQQEPPPAPESPAIAAVRATAKKFTDAFNKGDAKAVASLWTNQGEYLGPAGDRLVGRSAIATAFAQFFQEHPQARITEEVASIRLLGPGVAVEEGTSILHASGDDSATSRTSYRVVHVLGKDGWLMASVQEWGLNSAPSTTLEDLAWLVGQWQAASGDVSARVTYRWEDNKAFITGKYTLKRGDNVIAQGTEVIANDPAGGLRSWRFDGGGGFGEASWQWDGRTWVIDGRGVIPDGSEVLALVTITPLSDDAFIWQSRSQTASGFALPGTRPIKVTRVESSPQSSPKTENAPAPRGEP